MSVGFRKYLQVRANTLKRLFACGHYYLLVNLCLYAAVGVSCRCRVGRRCHSSFYVFLNASLRGSHLPCLLFQCVPGRWCWSLLACSIVLGVHWHFLLQSSLSRRLVWLWLQCWFSGRLLVLLVCRCSLFFCNLCRVYLWTVVIISGVHAWMMQDVICTCYNDYVVRFVVFELVFWVVEDLSGFGIWMVCNESIFFGFVRLSLEFSIF